jgi:hypothetical protein
MAIEIRELQIEVSVTRPQTETASANPPAPGGSTNPAANFDQSAIVAACVEKVMEILKNKTER